MIIEVDKSTLLYNKAILKRINIITICGNSPMSDSSPPTMSLIAENSHFCTFRGTASESIDNGRTLIVSETGLLYSSHSEIKKVQPFKLPEEVKNFTTVRYCYKFHIFSNFKSYLKIRQQFLAGLLTLFTNSFP